MKKTIIGKANGHTIMRFIQNYQPHVPEQEETEKRTIKEFFEEMGIDEELIEYEESIE